MVSGSHGFRFVSQGSGTSQEKRKEGIETIATVTVLKKERPDSLGTDIFNEITEVQNVYYYDSYQQNPNKCIVQEDVHNYIRCICRCIKHDKV